MISTLTWRGGVCALAEPKDSAETAMQMRTAKKLDFPLGKASSCLMTSFGMAAENSRE
jgi:hypothetical protein